ncbi:MAG: SLC13 family permease [Planctomycetota bacterium]
MPWEAWTTVGVVTLVLVLLTLTQIVPDIVLVAGVTLLLVTGILTPEQALSGMANEGMITVGVLYVVVAGLQETGASGWIAQKFLGEPKSLLGAQLKMMFPVAGVSAFMNNTPVVAMFMPAIRDWAKKYGLSASKLMMPLSYAAILGGICTLIGTSTNLVVNGLVKDIAHQAPFGMWDITAVGVTCSVVGMLYMVTIGRLLLPDRKAAISQMQDPREYTVEMLVETGSPLVGKTIEQAGLRRLPGMFLAEIERAGQIIPAVGPEERLQAEDRLLFVGVVESVVDLQKIRGLKPATNQVFKLDSPRLKRCLIEAVVSPSCRILGQTIRDGQFRKIYNAVVIAVSRNGERIKKKIGDIILHTGDTLLLEATPSFAERHRNSREFYLVSPVENSNPPSHERAIVAILILLAMIAVVTVEWMDMLQAGMLAAGAMIATRCCTAAIARRTVDWQILIAIAASFGIGQALKSTGVAALASNYLIALAGGNAWATLAVVYAVTMILTELITNNAAAVLVFPFAFSAAESLDASFKPFAIAIMIAASCGFASPLGYQTHMMVYGPGGYRFSDFVRVGLPLDLVIWATAMIAIPYFFPF